MSIVQSKAATGATSGTVTVTLDTAPTDGHSLLVLFSSANSGTMTGPSGFVEDLNGSSGTSPAGANCLFGIWHKNSLSGQSATVGVTIPTAGRYALLVIELTEPVKDAVALGTSSNGSTCAAPGVTAASSGTVIAVAAGPPVNAHTPTWDDGFTAGAVAEIVSPTNGAAIYTANKSLASGVASGLATATIGEVEFWRGAQINFGASVAVTKPPVIVQRAAIVRASTR